MVLFIRIIGIPLVVALVAWVLIELIQMNTKERIGHSLKVCSVVAALIVGLINSTNSLCNKLEATATEIVALIPKISHAVNYEIGAGDICRTYDGRPSRIPDEKLSEAYELMRANGYLLGFKLLSLPMDKKVADASKNYSNAIRDVQKYCKADEGFRSEELDHKKSIVNDSSWKLIEALGIFVAQCRAITSPPPVS